MTEIVRRYIALVTDPELNNEILVFSLRARGPKQARQSVHQWYESQGWEHERISIRLVNLREKDVQFIGHATAPKEVEAIRALCEEVLILAADESSIDYADKLRGLVQAFDIGQKVFRDRYETVQEEEDEHS